MLQHLVSPLLTQSNLKCLTSALIFRLAGVILAEPWDLGRLAPTAARTACMIRMVSEQRHGVVPSAPRIVTRVGPFEPQ